MTRVYYRIYAWDAATELNTNYYDEEAMDRLLNKKTIARG